MQLHVARLCLDCEELHEQQTCPVCSSESFVYISRWVPTPERRTRPRDVPSRETASVYRDLLDRNNETPSSRRWLKRSVLGVAAVSMLGWAWRPECRAAWASAPLGFTVCALSHCLLRMGYGMNSSGTHAHAKNPILSLRHRGRRCSAATFRETLQPGGRAHEARDGGDAEANADRDRYLALEAPELSGIGRRRSP
jgi:hypothetical protein